MRGDLIALDLETTGLDVQQDSIIEIGAVRLRDGQVIAEYTSLVDPGFAIPAETTRITGIDQEDLRGAPTLKIVLPQISEFIGSSPVIAHSAALDVGFMQRFGVLKGNPVIDTLELASVLLPRVPRYNLSALTKFFQIELENAHRALEDARATALLYWQLWHKALALPFAVLDEIVTLARPFDWEARLVFEQALAQRETERATAAPLSLDVFAPYQDEPAAPPAEHTTRLDVDAVTGLLDAGGALSRILPGYEHRPQQLVVTRAVTEAFNESRHLLVEAGTGTGKSLGYLLPAMQWAAATGQRVVISTNTTQLQEQLLHQDVPRIASLLAQPVRVRLMKGRDHYLCPRRLEAVRRRRPSHLDEMRTVAKLLVWLLDSQTGDRGEINLRFGENFAWSRLSARDEGCTLHRCAGAMQGACPFYKARRQAEAAEVLIVNHALLIADATGDNRVLPEYRHLIVDEAHQLEEAITGSLSTRIDQTTLLRRLAEPGSVTGGILGDLLASARRTVPEKHLLRLESFIADMGEALRAMQARARAFFARVNDLLKDAGQDEHLHRLDAKLRQHASFVAVQGAWRALAEYFDTLADAMQQLIGALERLEKHAIPAYDDHLNSLTATARYLREMHAHLNAFILQPDPNTIYWLNAADNPEYTSLQSAPLHIGPLMEQHLWQNKDAVILTSATLQIGSGFQYLRERLYADQVPALAVDSPFDYKASTLIYIPEDIPEPNRPGYQKAVERAIIELAAALDGRVMALFTSYGQLRETAANIAPRLSLGGITVYDQATGGNREALLDSFKSTSKAVLLGTRSFWEGVDIPGDGLSALVIVRLPFAVPNDPVFAARSETYRNHFSDYAVPDAVLRFRQGFGRLIRTRTDRGIVTVLDSRIISKGYGTTFLEALPDCTLKYGAASELAHAARDWLK
ncbi:MAG: exonuclease domain-containing protein [Anaerolineae bacterium]|jgi:DNA polymerase-3 subunit epsilon/ATP-dependent DNA helicase DinG|nr:exonuclease domain-containing protein [Anaerolineae bacterium]